MELALNPGGKSGPSASVYNCLDLGRVKVLLDIDGHGIEHATLDSSSLTQFQEEDSDGVEYRDQPKYRRIRASLQHQASAEVFRCTSVAIQ
jgi:hypothetical protein